ncbi:helix-turn-helix domain-containing protein [Gordoniibacillus kamchatkensis]|nr:helix-turn-helix domain-containing protein [Paenibacillus sp. VKM B-2647]
MNGQGQVWVEELCRQAGYTRRHLDRTFAELVGVSPKQLAGIVRFHRYYRMMNAAGGTSFSQLKEWYDAYYDRSHFVKEFQKYTGLSPREYKMRPNSFGTIFLQ